jgi:two-component system response regulator DesR
VGCCPVIGLAVAESLSALAVDIAFVVFSSNSGPAYRKRYFGEGAEAFLDKSTEFDQLVQTVAKASRYVAC